MTAQSGFRDWPRDAIAVTGSFFASRKQCLEFRQVMQGGQVHVLLHVLEVVVASDTGCGSRRILLAAAEVQPNWHFNDQGVDLACIRMAAINFALRNTCGHVIWGNTLGLDQRLVYDTGHVEVCGNAIRRLESSDEPHATFVPMQGGFSSDQSRGTQLQLFE